MEATFKTPHSSRGGQPEHLSEAPRVQPEVLPEARAPAADDDGLLPLRAPVGDGKLAVPAADDAQGLDPVPLPAVLLAPVPVPLLGILDDEDVVAETVRCSLHHSVKQTSQ